jgi:eukaryotic translation initiation factor 2C
VTPLFCGFSRRDQRDFGGDSQQAQRRRGDDDRRGGYEGGRDRDSHYRADGGSWDDRGHRGGGGGGYGGGPYGPGGGDRRDERSGRYDRRDDRGGGYGGQYGPGGGGGQSGGYGGGQYGPSGGGGRSAGYGGGQYGPSGGGRDHFSGGRRDEFRNGQGGRGGGGGFRGRGRGRGGGGGPPDWPSNLATFTPSPPEQNSGSRAGQRPSEEQKFVLENQGELTAIAPRRPGHLDKGAPVKVMSNFYRVNIDPKKELFMYGFYFQTEPKGRFPPDKLRAIFGALVKGEENSQFFPAGVEVAFDGGSMIYASAFLPLPEVVDPETGERFFEKLCDVPFQEGNRRQTFHMKVKLLGSRKLGNISAYIEGGGMDELPADCIAALDIVLRHVPALTHTLVGSSLFSSRRATELCQGAQAWDGFYQSLRLLSAGSLLNMDVSCTAFLKPMPVHEFCKEFLPDATLSSLAERLADPRARRKILEQLKSRVIITRHTSIPRKYKVVGLTREPAREKVFQMEDGVNQTVAGYFQEKYGALRFPELPCMEVKVKKMTMYLPMEMCTLVEGQRIRSPTDKQTSQMMGHSVKTPDKRLKAIDGLMGDVLATEDYAAFIGQFGLSVDQVLTELPARILETPTVMARDKKNGICDPKDGEYDMRSKQFYQPANLRSWAAVSFSTRADMETCRVFLRELNVFLHGERGLESPTQTPPPLISSAEALRDAAQHSSSYHNNSREDEVKIALDAAIEQAKKIFGEPPQIVVCFKDDPDDVLYPGIKNHAERRLGIPTQCVLQQHIKGVKKAYLGNLSYKINLKLGGTNAYVENLPVVQQDMKLVTAFVGVDVNHPRPGQFNTPSIASVTCSMDEIASRYAARTLVQKGRAEMVVNMEDPMESLMLQFQRDVGELPNHLMVFRDGVSEGQFERVLREELSSLRKGCAKLKVKDESGKLKPFEPLVTLVVVRKRHHARLFSADSRLHAGRTCNLKPGTVVDSGITSLRFFDFYLQSHLGLLGTSRPCLYTVLWDDLGLSANDMISTAYRSCYSYTRCNKAVSMPAPVYYAHVLALRASMLMSKVVGSHYSDSASQQSGRSGRSQVPGGPPVSREEAREINPEWLERYQDAITVDDRLEAGATGCMYFV